MSSTYTHFPLNESLFEVLKGAVTTDNRSLSIFYTEDGEEIKQDDERFNSLLDQSKVFVDETSMGEIREIQNKKEQEEKNKTQDTGANVNPSKDQIIEKQHEEKADVLQESVQSLSNTARDSGNSNPAGAILSPEIEAQSHHDEVPGDADSFPEDDNAENGEIDANSDDVAIGIPAKNG